MTSDNAVHSTSSALSDEPSALYGQKETAEALGVTLRTLRYWRDVDFGPYWQELAGRFVYFADDVQLWGEVLEDDDFS
jgi:hypothetical protein